MGNHGQRIDTEEGVEDVVVVIERDDRETGQGALHVKGEVLVREATFAARVVDYQEAPFQKVLAERPHLLVTRVPVAHLHDVRDWVLE